MTRRRYRPFLKTVAATLAASSAIVVRERRGTLSADDVDAVLQTWQRRVFAAGQARLVAHGVERYQDAGPPTRHAYVVMTNHQSLLDVPTVVATWPGRIRMVGKVELSRVPVWGRAMRAIGTVFVDRADRAQSLRALEEAKEQLRQGTSIWIAPEGTRHRDGELGPLKKGGFHLACSLQAPIAPAWIEGTAEVISPDSFGVHPGRTVTIVYGEPIVTDGRSPGDLVDEVRAALLGLQATARAMSAG
jgi:1-acyl-sn-glycerol-3-phosphate acyltransferase